VDPLDVIKRTGAPAFATDEGGRITIWNKGAEELLGYPASRVLGKSCHEIVRGLDVFGNRFCNHPCALNCMVEHRESVHHFELDVQSESGDTVPTGVSIVVIPGPKPRQHTMIHFLERIDRPREVNALLHRLMAGGPPPAESALPASGPPIPASVLTSRELEVLRLLADGTSTRAIADSLCISITTTRNHIQNIFRKLDVHSKLEAVSLALRSHLF
jgi:PAS domain S-box-containing protein